MENRVQKITQKVLFESNGRILMMRDKRGNWELPGGTLNFAEDPDEGLKREILEEMNLAPESYKIGNFLTSFNMIRSFNDTQYHFFALVFRGELMADTFQISDEHDRYGWFTLEEIDELQMGQGYKELFKKLKL